MEGIKPTRMSSCVTLLVIPPRFNICIFIIFLIAKLSLQEEGITEDYIGMYASQSLLSIKYSVKKYFKIILLMMLLIINFNWVDLSPHYSSPKCTQKSTIALRRSACQPANHTGSKMMANTVIFGAQMQKRRTGRVAKGFAEVGIHQHCVSDGLGRVENTWTEKCLKKLMIKPKRKQHCK